MAFTDTVEWPECNLDEATVALVVCMFYTDAQLYKLCVLCQTGLNRMESNSNKSRWERMLTL